MDSSDLHTAPKISLCSTSTSDPTTWNDIDTHEDKTLCNSFEGLNVGDDDGHAKFDEVEVHCCNNDHNEDETYYDEENWYDEDYNDEETYHDHDDGYYDESSYYNDEDQIHHEEDQWYDDDDDDDDEDDDDDVGFKERYSVYPLSHIDKTHLEAGNKIILPHSALEPLMDIGVDFPMLFKIENHENGKTSHCGVLEFSGEEEGLAIMPEWMMKNMSLEEGGMISLENVTLDRATYVKLQPHSMEFLGLRSPKDVLEGAFVLGYSCLTVGDTIVIMHEGKTMYVDVVDAKPSNAVCIIETDVEVDFALPLDYKEPEKPVPKAEEPPKFVPFSGRARRLSDKGESSEESSSVVDDVHTKTVQLSENKNKIVFGGGSLKSTCSNGSTKPSDEKAGTLNTEKTLKPFTGMKYRLMDS